MFARSKMYGIVGLDGTHAACWEKDMSSIQSQIDRNANIAKSTQADLTVLLGIIREAVKYGGMLAPKAFVETPEGTIQFSLNGERYEILGIKMIS